MSYETLHWWLVNKLARLFGTMAIFVGTGFAAWGVYYFFHPEASADVNTISGNASVDYLIPGLFLFLTWCSFFSGEALRTERLSRQI